MSACRGFQDDLTAFAYGDLPPRRMGEVGLHAGACPDCRAELEEIRSTLALASLWEAPEPASAPIVLPRRAPRALRWAAAAALLLAASGAWALRPRGVHTPPPSPERPVDPAVQEILREEGRADLADRLLASCNAAEVSARAPQLLIQIRACVPDAASYLCGKARGGDPYALTLLARAWPDKALRAAPDLLRKPGGAPAALKTLEEAGVETAGLVPALLKAGLVEEASRILREGKGRLPLSETLEAWEAMETDREEIGRGLSTALARAGTEDLLRILRTGKDLTWRLAAPVLAGREDPRVPAALVEGWRDPSRKHTALEALGRIRDPRLTGQALDLLAGIWMRDEGACLPPLPGIREALGRRIAASSRREAEAALGRLGPCDDVLASALEEASDPVFALRLAGRFGTSALIPAIEGRAGAEPRIRGLARSVIGALSTTPEKTPSTVSKIQNA